MWLALFIIAKLCLAVESIYYAAIALWSTLIDIAFGHTENPILLIAITISWIRLAISPFLKASEFYYTRISRQTGCNLIVIQELVLIRIKHLLIPMAQFHFAQIV